MNKEKQDIILQAYINKRGESYTNKKVVEELLELATELVKLDNDQQKLVPTPQIKKRLVKIYQEMGDVSLRFRQLQLIRGEFWKPFAKRKLEKWAKQSGIKI